METGPELGLMGLGGFFSEGDGDPQRRNMVRFTSNTALRQLCEREASRRKDNECCWRGGDKNWSGRGVMKRPCAPHTLGKGTQRSWTWGQQS